MSFKCKYNKGPSETECCYPVVLRANRTKQSEVYRNLKEYDLTERCYIKKKVNNHGLTVQYPLKPSDYCHWHDKIVNGFRKDTPPHFKEPCQGAVLFDNKISDDTEPLVKATTIPGPKLQYHGPFGDFPAYPKILAYSFIFWDNQKHQYYEKIQDTIPAQKFWNPTLPLPERNELKCTRVIPLSDNRIKYLTFRKTLSDYMDDIFVRREEKRRKKKSKKPQLSAFDKLRLLFFLAQIFWTNSVHLKLKKLSEKWIDDNIPKSKQVAPLTQIQPPIKETYYYNFKRQEGTKQNWWDTGQVKGAWFPKARPYPHEHPDYRKTAVREDLETLQEFQLEEWEYKYHTKSDTTRKVKTVEYPGSCEHCNPIERTECEEKNYQRFINRKEIKLCKSRQKYANQDYLAAWEKTVSEASDLEPYKQQPAEDLVAGVSFEGEAKWWASIISSDDEPGYPNDWTEQKLFEYSGHCLWDRVKTWADMRFYRDLTPEPDQYFKLIFPLPPPQPPYKSVWVDSADTDFTVLRMFYFAYSKQVEIAKHLKLSEARVSQILTEYRALMRKHTQKNLSETKEDKIIFELFLKGKQQVVIADKIGKSQPYVSGKLQPIKAFVKKRLKRHITIQNKNKKLEN